MRPSVFSFPYAAFTSLCACPVFPSQGRNPEVLAIGCVHYPGVSGIPAKAGMGGMRPSVFSFPYAAFTSLCACPVFPAQAGILKTLPSVAFTIPAFLDSGFRRNGGNEAIRLFIPLCGLHKSLRLPRLSGAGRNPEDLAIGCVHYPGVSGFRLSPEWGVGAPALPGWVCSGAARCRRRFHPPRRCRLGMLRGRHWGGPEVAGLLSALSRSWA